MHFYLIGIVGFNLNNTSFDFIIYLYHTYIIKSMIDTTCNPTHFKTISIKPQSGLIFYKQLVNIISVSNNELWFSHILVDSTIIKDNMIN